MTHSSHPPQAVDTKAAVLLRFDALSRLAVLSQALLTCGEDDEDQHQHGDGGRSTSPAAGVGSGEVDRTTRDLTYVAADASFYFNAALLSDHVVEAAAAVPPAGDEEASLLPAAPQQQMLKQLWEHLYMLLFRAAGRAAEEVGAREAAPPESGAASRYVGSARGGGGGGIWGGGSAVAALCAAIRRCQRCEHELLLHSRSLLTATTAITVDHLRRRLLRSSLSSASCYDKELDAAVHIILSDTTASSMTLTLCGAVILDAFVPNGDTRSNTKNDDDSGDGNHTRYMEERDDDTAVNDVDDADGGALRAAAVAAAFREAIQLLKESGADRHGGDGEDEGDIMDEHDEAGGSGVLRPSTLWEAARLPTRIVSSSSPQLGFEMHLSTNAQVEDGAQKESQKALLPEELWAALHTAGVHYLSSALLECESDAQHRRRRGIGSVPRVLLRLHRLSSLSSSSSSFSASCAAAEAEVLWTWAGQRLERMTQQLRALVATIVHQRCPHRTAAGEDDSQTWPANVHPRGSSLSASSRLFDVWECLQGLHRDITGMVADLEPFEVHQSQTTPPSSLPPLTNPSLWRSLLLQWARTAEEYILAPAAAALQSRWQEQQQGDHHRHVEDEEHEAEERPTKIHSSLLLLLTLLCLDSELRAALGEEEWTRREEQHQQQQHSTLPSTPPATMTTMIERVHRMWVKEWVEEARLAVVASICYRHAAPPPPQHTSLGVLSDGSSNKNNNRTEMVPTKAVGEAEHNEEALLGFDEAYHSALLLRMMLADSGDGKETPEGPSHSNTSHHHQQRMVDARPRAAAWLLAQQCLLSLQVPLTSLMTFRYRQLPSSELGRAAPDETPDRLPATAAADGQRQLRLPATIVRARDVLVWDDEAGGAEVEEHRVAEGRRSRQRGYLSRQASEHHQHHQHHQQQVEELHRNWRRRIQSLLRPRLAAAASALCEGVEVDAIQAVERAVQQQQQQQQYPTPQAAPPHHHKHAWVQGLLDAAVLLQCLHRFVVGMRSTPSAQAPHSGLALTDAGPPSGVDGLEWEGIRRWLLLASAVATTESGLCLHAVPPSSSSLSVLLRRHDLSDQRRRDSNTKTQVEDDDDEDAEAERRRSAVSSDDYYTARPIHSSATPHFPLLPLLAAEQSATRGDGRSSSSSPPNAAAAEPSSSTSKRQEAMRSVLNRLGRLNALRPSSSPSSNHNSSSSSTSAAAAAASGFTSVFSTGWWRGSGGSDAPQAQNAGGSVSPSGL